MSGACQKREIAPRCETIHSMLRRLDGWDYRGRGIYQITIVLADRASKALGRLEVRDSAARGRAQDGGSAAVGAAGKIGGSAAVGATGKIGGSAVGGSAAVGAAAASAVGGSAAVGAVGGSAAVGAFCARPRAAGWLAVEAAKGLGLEPEAVEARVVPSEIGAIVEACWREIAAQWPGVRPLAHQLMPDHFHGILFVERPIEKTLGNIVGSFKSKSSSRALGVVGASCAEPRAARSLWAPGYQDTVLLHEGQLANMTRYLADNPRRLAIKRLFPDLFRVIAELRLPLGGGLVGHFAALGNRFLLGRPLVQVQVSRRDFGYKREPKRGRDLAARGQAQNGARGQAQNGGGGLKICRDARGEPIVEFATAVYDEKKRGLFAAAKHGAVLLSPCVSDGERQIAREALKAGLPLVTMVSEGLSPFAKPAGRLFDACAEGRLLMLVPAAWQRGDSAARGGDSAARGQAQNGARGQAQDGGSAAVGASCAGARAPRSLSRFDAVAMNRLCQALAGAGAATINYHGMRPANIDELAFAAARVERETGDGER